MGVVPAESEAEERGPAREVGGLAWKGALTSFWHQAQLGPDSMQSRQVLTLYLVHSWESTGVRGDGLCEQGCRPGGASRWAQGLLSGTGWAHGQAR